MTGSESKVIIPTVTSPSNTELQIPVTTPKTSVVKSNAVKSKKAVKKAGTSRQAEIASLNDQLQFAKIELSAQVDLLKVIMDTNVFGTEAKSAESTPFAALKSAEENN